MKRMILPDLPSGRKAMPEPPKRLGRGISSLLSSHKTSKLASQLDMPESTAVTESVSAPMPVRHRTSRIPLDCVAPNPRQPRRAISEKGIAQLADSIKRNGVIQPIVVRPVAVGVSSLGTEHVPSQASVKYELIVGERRWRAAMAAGLSDVPAIIREANEEQLLELALIENIQREDLNAIDIALAYQQFKDRFGLNADHIGERVGEDRSTVTNYLRLLELPQEIQDMVGAELISMGHARALVGLRSHEQQLTLAESVVRKSLSVRALEDLIRRRREAGRSTAASARDISKKRPLIRDLEQRFTQALQTKVTIQESRRKNQGKIIIEYNSVDDFEAICEKLGI